jgi:hypothetical protein
MPWPVVTSHRGLRASAKQSIDRPGHRRQNARGQVVSQVKSPLSGQKSHSAESDAPDSHRSRRSTCSAAARAALTISTWTTSASAAASISRAVVSITGRFNASACPRRYAAQQSIRELERSGCPRGPVRRAWRTGEAQSSRTTRTNAVRIRAAAAWTNDGRVWPSRMYTSAPSGSPAKRSIHSWVVAACHRSGPLRSRHMASAEGTPTASK